MTHLNNHNFSSNAPGQAPLTNVGGTGVAFDYSDHLDRIVLALEQMAIASTETANQLNDINTKLDILVNNSTTIAQTFYTISGIITGDIVDISNIYYANYSTKNVGNNILVTISNN